MNFNMLELVIDVQIFDSFKEFNTPSAQSS